MVEEGCKLRVVGCSQSGKRKGGGAGGGWEVANPGEPNVTPLKSRVHEDEGLKG